MRGPALLAVLAVALGCEKAGDETPRPGPVRLSDAAVIPPPPSPGDAGPGDDLREAARNLVREGFDQRDDMIDFLVEVHSDGTQKVSKATATALIDEELKRHRAEEANWRERTDCDRLDAAFAQLERSGILARQDFSDCGTCGAAEISGEMREARARGANVRGYTFFHDQDTESALDGDLFLNYGARAETEKSSVAIGHEVVRALRAEGLAVDWDGRLERRIGVRLDWRKRRFTKAPAP